MICPRSKKQSQDLNPGMSGCKSQALLIKPKTELPAHFILRSSSLIATKSIHFPLEMR